LLRVETIFLAPASHVATTLEHCRKRRRDYRMIVQHGRVKGFDGFPTAVVTGFMREECLALFDAE
jgi:hypothetical protein